jgi:hypothetical protein
MARRDKLARVVVVHGAGGAPRDDLPPDRNIQSNR